MRLLQFLPPTACFRTIPCEAPARKAVLGRSLIREEETSALIFVLPFCGPHVRDDRDLSISGTNAVTFYVELRDFYVGSLSHNQCQFCILFQSANSLGSTHNRRPARASSDLRPLRSWHCLTTMVLAAAAVEPFFLQID